MRRDAHHVRFASDEAAAVPVDVERLVVFDVHAGALEHLERGVVDVLDVVGGQHVEQDPLPPQPADL